MWTVTAATALFVLCLSSRGVLAEETKGESEFIGPFAANVAGALTGAAQGLATGGIAGGIVGGLAGGLLGANIGQPQQATAPPKVAVKLMPSKHMKIAKRDLQSIIGDLRHEIRKQVYNVEKQYMNTAKPGPRALMYSSDSFLPGTEAARFQETKPRNDVPPTSLSNVPVFQQTDRVRPRHQQQIDSERGIVEALNELSDLAEVDKTPESAAKKEVILADGPL
ncbi:hypothetical protein TGP89_272680 [Toxoplasma gondii p89]|uniref:Transmembrane protein n=1 Tax=Toxoplasma gondii p89 TaxID=943119 RepID=A0A086L511_TOXGO|nr:hypothetical protein TGP89_272680 [Toxoplasma gondii p89]